MCNSLQISNDSGTSVKYLADSPDEKALCEAGNRLGITLVFTSETSAHVDVHGELREYEKFLTFEFDNERKRMSVIVWDKSANSFFLFSKGAGQELEESHTLQGLQRVTMDHMNKFASQGLRTLVVNSRKLSEEEAESIKTTVEAARTTIEDRAKKVSLQFLDYQNVLIHPCSFPR